MIVNGSYQDQAFIRVLRRHFVIWVLKEWFVVFVFVWARAESVKIAISVKVIPFFRIQFNFRRWLRYLLNLLDHKAWALWLGWMIYQIAVDRLKYRLIRWNLIVSPVLLIVKFSLNLTLSAHTLRPFHSHIAVQAGWLWLFVSSASCASDIPAESRVGH